MNKPQTLRIPSSNDLMMITNTLTHLSNEALNKLYQGDRGVWQTYSDFFVHTSTITSSTLSGITFKVKLIISIDRRLIDADNA